MTGLPLPAPLLEVWRTFDDFPMETLTKAWVAKTHGPRQRTVEEMERHRKKTGASGNCFDLALWLQHRLHRAGLGADIISDRIADKDAHVAVLAHVEGRAFLCDLGDMWLHPLALDLDTTTPVSGLFPAARIRHHIAGDTLTVSYHRPGDKASSQSYCLRAVTDAELAHATAVNQAYLAQLLVEVRDFSDQSHWEFADHESRRSTDHGLFDEPLAESYAAWATRIAARTGMRADYVEACLEAFAALTTSPSAN